nr:MAG TPA: hypothetical protein [Caudoviricetes sp.]
MVTTRKSPCASAKRTPIPARHCRAFLRPAVVKEYLTTELVSKS